MNDNEIIKALERCWRHSGKCFEDCPNHDGFYDHIPTCRNMLMKEALNLINRQKAEIAELQHKNFELEAEIEKLQSLIKEADEYFSEGDFANGIAIIISFVKEMAGERYGNSTRLRSI